MMVGFVFFFSSRRRHTRCALVTGVHTCALPIYAITIIGFRMMLSLPFFAVIGWFQARRARRGQLPVLTPGERLKIIFLGFIGYYLSSYLDFLGLQTISAGLERLILFLSPPFVLLISWLSFKRSEEHTSELQSLMRYSFAVFC